MILKNFSLLTTFRNIKPFSMSFEKFTVIVGENGSGKSSFFDLLTNDQYRKLIKIEHIPNLVYKFFDTEKQNPRIKNSLSDSKNISFDIASRFRSHGETMLPILLAANAFEKELILIDEPEAGISLSNQKKILQSFKKAIDNDCQIIISTHSYFFIKNVPNVFNMTTKKWISSQKFLANI